MCRCEQRTSFPRSVRRIFLFSFIVFSFFLFLFPRTRCAQSRRGNSRQRVLPYETLVSFFRSFPILSDDLFYPIVTHVEKPSDLSLSLFLSCWNFLAAGSGKRLHSRGEFNAGIIIMRLLQEAGRVFSLNRHTLCATARCSPHGLL